MATIKFTETFATANANQTVKFEYQETEGVGVIIGYSGGMLLVQTDSPKAWKLTGYLVERQDITITSKEPLDPIANALFVPYEDITEIIEDNPVVTEVESIGSSFTYALIMAIMFLVFLFCCSNATYSQVKVSKEKTEVLANTRFGHVHLMVSEGIYAVTVPDATNAQIEIHLASHGYNVPSGTVVIILGNKEAAMQVLEYLANNKPAKGEDVTIEGNEGMIITYSGLLGGWQFNQHGMVGNLSQGEAKKFLKAINK